jgi:ubiquinone/menaquinone biosynthesis C-methylase UbiE
MTDFQKIYSHHVREYDLLISREDYQGNLLPALAAIRPLTGLSLVELGAGTGRLTRLLGSYLSRIMAIDISAHMLEVARSHLSSDEGGNWALVVADNRRLPAAGQSADLAIAGWSLGHFVGWYGQSWPKEIGLALTEMKRVLRPGGTVVIIETLGTGRASPEPPTEGLAEYYRFLEKDWGFSRTWIRTDYSFESPDEAENLTRFFFGDELADHIRREQLEILPECTGIWWLTI